MNKKEIREKTRAELETLANSLIAGGIKTSDSELILIGNGLITLLAATQDERSTQELQRLLMQFCIKQVKRDSGMSEEDIQLDNLLRESGICLN
jgi:hypothetical protein